jgi:hypothetical protein
MPHPPAAPRLTEDDHLWPILAERTVEIRIGRIQRLAVIGRVRPKLADSIVARATP